MSFALITKLARYSLYLLKEFRWPLAVVAVLVFGGGALFAGSLDFPYGKACFTAFMLMFAQPTVDFPNRWFDQMLFFAIPIIGLGAVADSVVRLGYLVFTSKRKQQEWWIMEASALRDHIVVCGLGRVGYRIAKELLALGERFVAIERKENSLFVEEIQDQDVPVIIGEGRLRRTLERANVPQARAIILATDDDLANLDVALTAREMKPDIRVVMRLFDDTLASKVAASFKLPAISSARVSAPAFVAAATGRSVLHAFMLDGQTIHVADVQVEKLAGRTIPQVQREFDITLVLHKSAGFRDLNPNHDRPLQAGDIVVVVAPMEKIQRMERSNRG
jgi:Trk K+ transport system NAD-binding subunit